MSSNAVKVASVPGGGRTISPMRGDDPTRCDLDDRKARTGIGAAKARYFFEAY